MKEHTPPRDLFDRLMTLPGLRIFAPFYHRHREVLLYLFFGGLTTLISWGSFYLLHYPMGINELISNILSWVLSVLFAFVTNRTWVFSNAAGRPLAAMGRFFASRLATLGLEEGLIFLFVTYLSFDAMVIKISGNLLVLALNYLCSKFFVFRKR